MEKPNLRIGFFTWVEICVVGGECCDGESEIFAPAGLGAKSDRNTAGMERINGKLERIRANLKEYHDIWKEYHDIWKEYHDIWKECRAWRIIIVAPAGIKGKSDRNAAGTERINEIMERISCKTERISRYLERMQRVKDRN
ncbi:preprotein translocase subunit Sss1 [Bacillus ectoiniformans]|uniref:hypothetical protein n=1 Tax=Bacillus ectoiniformans TaxID=1494429 RepID=UPI00195B7232|nr:hypothetical protein [Bacillus ectoiniformans]MBM7648567.1 preprotein translocase subunit Sss1 [Bacillus ectoiniformans]